MVPFPPNSEQETDSRQEPGMHSEREPIGTWLVLSPDHHWFEVWV